MARDPVCGMNVRTTTATTTLGRSIEARITSAPIGAARSSIGTRQFTRDNNDQNRNDNRSNLRNNRDNRDRRKTTGRGSVRQRRCPRKPPGKGGFPFSSPKPREEHIL